MSRNKWRRRRADSAKIISLHHHIVGGDLKIRSDNRVKVWYLLVGLDENAKADEFLTWYKIEVENYKLDDLKEFSLYIRWFEMNTLCKLTKSVLWFQDEVVGIILVIYTAHHIKDHITQMTRLCL